MIERNLAMIENGKQQVFKSADAEKADVAGGKKVTKAADLIRMYELLLQVSWNLMVLKGRRNVLLVSEWYHRYTCFTKW